MCEQPVVHECRPLPKMKVQMLFHKAIQVQIQIQQRPITSVPILCKGVSEVGNNSTSALFCCFMFRIDMFSRLTSALQHICTGVSLIYRE